MSRKLPNRTNPLTPSDVEEFFRQHLPYRISLLRTYKLINEDYPQYQKDIPNDIIGSINNCSSEASRIASRMFIEFMGLGEKNGNLSHNREYFSYDNINSYEIKIIDLGGRWVDKNNLDPGEKDLLVRTYRTAHKATAHFTHNEPYGG